MVFLAISAISVHKGQSLKPEALFENSSWTEDLKLLLPDFSEKCEKEAVKKKNQRKYFYKTDCAGRKLLHPYRQPRGNPALKKHPKRMDRNIGTEGTNTGNHLKKRIIQLEST